jgi:uncharacterized protein YbjQ (UPF0145 family)
MRMMILAAALGLAACGPRGDYIKMADQTPQEVTASMNVRVFEGSAFTGNVSQYLKSVSAFSCKNQAYDPPPSKGDALSQLRIKAMRLGANAIVNVYFDTDGTDAWGTNCWKSVTATGDAVVIQ